MDIDHESDGVRKQSFLPSWNELIYLPARTFIDLTMHDCAKSRITSTKTRRYLYGRIDA